MLAAARSSMLPGGAESVGLQQHGCCPYPGDCAYFTGLPASAAGCFVLRGRGIRRGASVAAEALVRAASVAADALIEAAAGLTASVAAEAWLAADAGGGLTASVAAEACTWAPDCASAAPASREAVSASIAFVIIFLFSSCEGEMILMHYLKINSAYWQNSVLTPFFLVQLTFFQCSRPALHTIRRVAEGGWPARTGRWRCAPGAGWAGRRQPSCAALAGFFLLSK